VGNEEWIIEMIEFSCPFGYIPRGRDTLKRVYEEKKRKYQRLAMNLKQYRRSEVRITAVVVSLMGAVYNQSLKDLQKVMGCTDQKIRKLGRKVGRNETLNVEGGVGRECRVINRRAEGWRSGSKGPDNASEVAREHGLYEPGKAP
jgi:hypothetical protein